MMMNHSEKNTRHGLRAGITGGIGSGKSTVCRIFEQLGVPVYDADASAKWLLAHDPELISGVKQIFGPEAYTTDGAYNRPFIAREAFSQPEKLAALNAIAHPAVERHARHWHEDQMRAGAPYTLKEAALMIESGSVQFIDFLIVVTAPEALRVQRVIARDGLSETEIRARMARQLPEEKKIELAQAVIVNDGEHSLVQQVWELHQKLKQLAAKKSTN